MLVRDLWEPREEARFFDVIRLELADGRCLYLERGFRTHPGAIYCCVKENATSGWNASNVHIIDDDLTAQAILDHYVQTIGVKNKSDVKPSGDP